MYEYVAHVSTNNMCEIYSSYTYFFIGVFLLTA